ncbi:MAG TPA: hypothetical protein VFX70_21460 [Mycobacteriales bacterium]|nr:hypothetical protein [Mycobacteriales bacterium]
MLRALADHQVEWVLSGSAVLAVYGAPLSPNDLDVVPALDPVNLRRVAALLTSLDAVPAHVPEWEQSLSVSQCRQWRPDPPTEQQLDHLFVTRLGMLDIPPRLTGTHDQLLPTATRLDLAGVPVWVCDPDEVLRRLPQPPRAKDRDRATAYAMLRARLRTDRRPVGLTRFIPTTDQSGTGRH